MKRIDSILVQLVVTTYDDDGRPVNEEVMKPQRIFVASDEKVQALIAPLNEELAGVGRVSQED